MLERLQGALNESHMMPTDANPTGGCTDRYGIFVQNMNKSAGLTPNVSVSALGGTYF